MTTPERLKVASHDDTILVLQNLSNFLGKTATSLILENDDELIILANIERYNCGYVRAE